MDCKQIQVSQVWTTPDELRKIADELERRWRLTQLGTAIPRIIFQSGKEEIHFITDQENMPKDTMGVDLPKAKAQ
jgi:hypothetical protein